MGTTSRTARVDLDAVATRQEFAAALTAVREAAGLTVRQVARQAGINPSTVGGYYSGRHLPPLRPDGGVRSLLRACGVTDPAELDRWQLTLARIRRAPGPRPTALRPPFPGLRPFGPDDAEHFHGRDDELGLLLAGLAESHAHGGMTVLIGPAGTGKTSLLRAGLIPRLQETPSDRAVVELTPGREPLDALATALARLATPTAAPGEVLADLRRSPAAARELVTIARPDPTERRIVLPPEGDGAMADPDPYPVIVVDQLEELVTQCTDDPDRTAFVAALASATRPGPNGQAAPAGVVLAVRQEFLPALARNAQLAGIVRSLARSDSSPPPVVLSAPTAAQVRVAVLTPARADGLEVEPALVDRLVRDVEASSPPALPRFAHALSATWRVAQRGRLTLADYLTTGGMADALEQDAEAAWRGLPDDGAREAAERLLSALVRTTPEGVVATGWAATDSRDGAQAAAVRAFIDLGLLTAGPDRVRLGSASGVEAWPRLARWAAQPDAVPPTLPLPAELLKPALLEPDPLVEKQDLEPRHWTRHWVMATTLVVVLLAVAGAALHWG